MSTQNVPVINDPVDYFPSQTEMNTIQMIAHAASVSGFYSGIGQKEKILMVLLQARELGIGPMFALNSGSDNIQGNVEMKPVLMNALIRKRGHSITVEHSDEKKCVLLGKRKDGDSIREEYTIEEATKAKLASKDNWQKYPKDMLYARCMSRLGRKLFADVLGNVYADGEVKEAKEVQLDEKKLKLAECEDVTDSHKPAECTTKMHISPECTTKTENVPPKEYVKVDANQAMKLQQDFMFIDDDCKKNMWTYLKDKHGVEEGKFEDIPESQYMVLINGIKRNLEKHEIN